jgi:hypothetical protein
MSGLTCLQPSPPNPCSSCISFGFFIWLPPAAPCGNAEAAANCPVDCRATAPCLRTRSEPSMHLIHHAPLRPCPLTSSTPHPSRSALTPPPKPAARGEAAPAATRPAQGPPARRPPCGPQRLNTPSTSTPWRYPSSASAARAPSISSTRPRHCWMAGSTSSSSRAISSSP